MSKNNTEALSIEEQALDIACAYTAGSSSLCPGYLHAWDHPETCEKNCTPKCENNCWKTYFLQQVHVTERNLQNN